MNFLRKKYFFTQGTYINVTFVVQIDEFLVELFVVKNRGHKNQNYKETLYNLTLLKPKIIDMVKKSLRALLSGLLLFCSTNISAQTTELTKHTENFTPWYVGVKGGIPFGISTFSSFGTG